ncbi:ribosome-recycling factor, mitochondrial-like [Ctenocephalides felis]|uniref:ribosome-recycling factor, mitochondrial-like n=1 Tax=Ctenocephalides felis TaxID=7515 RepID=UPI000E6E419C|nr:ribosome-recycling factor, mitochondrial-like [Ctenocephalides felis]
MLRILSRRLLVHHRQLSAPILSNNIISKNLQYIQSARHYAKGKDIKKDKSKKKQKVAINEEQLSEVLDVDNLKKQMTKCVDHLKDEFVKNLSLRSTTGAIDALPVKFEGKEYELQELAQIVRKNPKTVVVNMNSFPQVIPEVLKALSKSGMNLNPQQDGTTLFIPVPKVTKEHRELLSKNAKTLFIKCRDSIKDNQNNAIKKVKKQTGLSEDLVHDVQLQITSIADSYLEEAQKLLDSKQQELIGEK